MPSMTSRNSSTSTKRLFAFALTFAATHTAAGLPTINSGLSVAPVPTASHVGSVTLNPEGGNQRQIIIPDKTFNEIVATCTTSSTGEINTYTAILKGSVPTVENIAPISEDVEGLDIDGSSILKDSHLPMPIELQLINLTKLMPSHDDFNLKNTTHGKNTTRIRFSTSSSSCTTELHEVQETFKNGTQVVKVGEYNTKEVTEDSEHGIVQSSATTHTIATTITRRGGSFSTISASMEPPVTSVPIYQQKVAKSAIPPATFKPLYSNGTMALSEIQSKDRNVITPLTVETSTPVPNASTTTTADLAISTSDENSIDDELHGDKPPAAGFYMEDMLSLTQTTFACLNNPTIANVAACHCLIEGFKLSDIALMGLGCFNNFQTKSFELSSTLYPNNVIRRRDFLIQDLEQDNGHFDAAFVDAYLGFPINNNGQVKPSETYCPVKMVQGEVVPIFKCYDADQVQDFLRLQRLFDEAGEAQQTKITVPEQQQPQRETPRPNIPLDDAFLAMIDVMTEDQLISLLNDLDGMSLGIQGQPYKKSHSESAGQALAKRNEEEVNAMAQKFVQMIDNMSEEQMMEALAGLEDAAVRVELELLQKRNVRKQGSRKFAKRDVVEEAKVEDGLESIQMPIEQHAKVENEELESVQMFLDKFEKMTEDELLELVNSLDREANKTVDKQE